MRAGRKERRRLVGSDASGWKQNGAASYRLCLRTSLRARGPECANKGENTLWFVMGRLSVYCTGTVRGAFLLLVFVFCGLRDPQLPRRQGVGRCERPCVSPPGNEVGAKWFVLELLLPVRGSALSAVGAVFVVIVVSELVVCVD